MVHGRAEIEAEIEAAEFCQRGLALADQLQVVPHVRQLVLPVADVVGAERHFGRIETVGQLAPDPPRP